MGFEGVALSSLDEGWLRAWARRVVRKEALESLQSPNSLLKSVVMYP